MSLAGMDDGQASRSPGLQQALIWLNGAPKLRDIVAEHFSESSRLKEVSLHVDDEQGAVCEVNLIGVWFRLDAQIGAVDDFGRVDCHV